jgi:hypothetical protein
MIWNGNECGKKYCDENVRGYIPITDYDRSETTVE